LRVWYKGFPNFMFVYGIYKWAQQGF
jgi:hypothetical protein